MVRSIAHARFAAALIAVCVGGASTSGVGNAQEVIAAGCECRAQVDCSCGRWTCPSCQAKTLCEPCEVPSSPNAISPSVPTTPGADSGVPAPTPSPSDEIPQAEVDANADSLGNELSAAPNAGPSTADLRNMLAMSSASGANLGGSGSSSRLGGETPEFMGDFLGPEAVYIQDSDYTFLPNSLLVTPGGRLGRQKLIENNSPIPQDRVFFNYSRFGNVPFTLEGTDVDRFTPGFEKTFLGGLASVELRTPFGSSVSSTTDGSGTFNDNNDAQFGNLFVGVKAILLGRDSWVVTGGVSVVAPTAEDSQMVDGSGRTLARIDNGSVHLMPFLGGAIQHSSRHFSQWMVQVDVDASGNDVFVDHGNGLSQIGTLQQQNLIYVDLNSGYWLYRAPKFQRNGITGIAWLNELHINRSLQSADVVDDNFVRFSSGVGTFDNINILTGFSTEFHRASRLGVGYALPIGNGSDNPFSNELRITFNRYF